ncbi:MAG: DUF58 domain-containing protein [Coriobacteriales bacterium]
MRYLLYMLGLAALVLPVLLLAHPVSYVPLVMMVLMLLVSWAYLQVLDRSVRASICAESCTCTRGQQAQLKVLLSNSCPLPAPRVVLEFSVSTLFQQAASTRSLSCALGPYQSTELAFDVSFSHLGSFEAGIRSVAVYDLLGLFKRTHRDGSMNAVVVQPAKVRLREAAVSDASADEASRALKPVPSDNEDYASVREYHRGDPMKTIHWNLSSRNPDGTLFTRLYEEYVNPTMAIVVDCCARQAPEETLMSLFDGLVECAVALGEQARMAGIEAELRFFDAAGEAARLQLAGSDSAAELVERMHRICTVGEASFDAEELLRSAGLKSGSASNVVLVSARLDGPSLNALSDIARQRRNAVACIAVPTELEGREREHMWEDLSALTSGGVSVYWVESNELGTEVRGL